MTLVRHPKPMVATRSKGRLQLNSDRFTGDFRPHHVHAGRGQRASGRDEYRWMNIASYTDPDDADTDLKIGVDTDTDTDRYIAIDTDLDVERTGTAEL